MSLGEIFLWEFMGTAILTLMGCGVVANTVLRKNRGHEGGFLLVNFGGASRFSPALASQPRLRLTLTPR